MVSSLLAPRAALADTDASPCQITVLGRPGKQFDPARIDVPHDCARFSVTLRHAGRNSKADAGHNWALARAEDIDGVLGRGLPHGPDHDWLDPADSRVLAHTAMLGGGESDTVIIDTRTLEPGRDYGYVCTFPSHAAMMRGVLVRGR